MATTKQRQISDRLPRKIITPITGVLSLVIGISGIMLFFHIEEGLVKGIHEWLGMAFAIVMLIHLAINWRAFKQHFKNSSAWISSGVVTAISAIFLVTTLTVAPQESPMRSVIRSIESAAVSDLAPIFKISQSEVINRFAQAGVVITTGEESLQELAGKNGIDPRRLIVALVDKADS